MLGEYASGPNGGDKAQWITDSFQQLQNLYNGIKLANWFNINKETDWRIDQNPKTALAYEQAVSPDYFLSSRDNLFSVTNYLQAQQKEYKSALEILKPYQKKNKLMVNFKPDNLKIDGNLDEWEDNLNIILEQKPEFLMANTNYSSTDEFFAKIGLFWDKENLYIGTRIKDDQPFNNQFENGDIWQGDCIEFVISLNPKVDLNRMYFENSDYQVLINPGNNKEIQPYIWNALAQKKLKGDIKTKAWEKGYDVEIKIPFKELGDFIPEPGMVIGFDMAVDDTGPFKKRMLQAVWYGDNTFYQNPSVWNLIEFK